MLKTIDDAASVLESEGLIVRVDAWGLRVATNRRTAGDIGVLDNVTGIHPDGNSWVAGFVTPGDQLRRIPGTLDELVSLIREVYARFRQDGGHLSDAVAAVTRPFVIPHSALQATGS